jgi:hypothetical protein
VFGFTGELNAAARATEEAAMDVPSPFFFGPSQVIHL